MINNFSRNVVKRSGPSQPTLIRSDGSVVDISQAQFDALMSILYEWMVETYNANPKVREEVERIKRNG